MSSLLSSVSVFGASFTGSPSDTGLASTSPRDAAVENAFASL